MPLHQGLSDLFKFFSDLEYSQEKRDVIGGTDREKKIELLENYKIDKNLYPILLNYADHLDDIKNLASNEIDDMWKECGVC